MKRTHIPALSSFEENIGFSRALRVGDHIFVSGHTATLPDGSVPATASEQADHIFAEIIRHVETLGGKAAHVVRVRMFVTDIADADAISSAFSRALGHARPAATLVAIAGLYRPEWKVEIEAEAVVTAD
ncbi:MAG: RidA family protein [Sphingobium sp.]|nr:RidA family protein [Sphingobium sp.]